MVKEKEKKVEVKDYSKILEQLKYCLFAVIALLAINTIVLVVVNSDEKTTTTTTTTTEGYDVSKFNSITPTEFTKLVNDDKASVVYFGRATCSYCVKFLPSMQKAQDEFGYKTNYVDVSAIETSSADYTNMVALIDGMKDSYNAEYSTSYTSLYGYTPTVVIVKNGKIQDIWIGYGEYETFKKFLTDNGIES